MSFCDINFRRKPNGEIQVKDKGGNQSPLYSKLVDYTNKNDVYSGREWFFNKLIEQGKIKSTDNRELSLGLYSIAFHSGKSENYWINRIEMLLPSEKKQVELSVENKNIPNSYTPSLSMYENFINKNQLYIGEEMIPLIGESEYYRYLVPILIKMNPGIKTEFTSKPFNTITGRLWEFNATKNVISKIYDHADDIRESNGLSIRELNYNVIRDTSDINTVVHELVHRTIQLEYEKQGKFGDEINELFDYALKNQIDDALYGYASPTEFLAEALSNPEFMRELNNIKFKEETVWSYLMHLISDFINNIVGESLNTNSVLAEVIRKTELVLQENIKEMSQETPVTLSTMEKEILDNWSTYFPMYEWMNNEQRVITAKMASEGKITLTCKI